MIHKPYAKFKGWLRENGLTYKDVAGLLDVSITTISAKINGKSDFLLSEIRVVKNAYNLDDSIFFENSVA